MRRNHLQRDVSVGAARRHWLRVAPDMTRKFPKPGDVATPELGGAKSLSSPLTDRRQVTILPSSAGRGMRPGKRSRKGVQLFPERRFPSAAAASSLIAGAFFGVFAWASWTTNWTLLAPMIKVLGIILGVGIAASILIKMAYSVVKTAKR